MANKLPKEQEILDKISRSEVTVSDYLWDTIYSLIENKLTIIDLLVNYYTQKSESIPKIELQSILKYLNDINNVFKKIINPEIIEETDTTFCKVKEESVLLDKDIKEIFSHYVGNDIQAINFIIGFYLDELNSDDITIEHQQKIIDYLESMKNVLYRLRTATKKRETLRDKIVTKIQYPMNYISELMENPQLLHNDKLNECLEYLKNVVELMNKYKT